MKDTFDEILLENSEPVIEEFVTDLEKAEYLQRLLVNASTNDVPSSEEHYMKSISFVVSFVLELSIIIIAL